MNSHLYRGLYHAALAVGLLAVAWVGAGYLHSNPLALLMTGLIGAFYLAGALELHRFGQDTAGLDRALDAAAAPPAALADWLAQVPAPLQTPVRLRLAGERVALPGPALTPYLAGLLVLLGMLGTFLGMVVTLNGTGLALEHATDLTSMRESLAAPVRGLGLAFGTSVAGVAASAVLGLLSALRRRARVQVAQRLDAAIATTLHSFTATHARAQQREAALHGQQQQAALLSAWVTTQAPALVDGLQGLMAQMAAQARLAAEQHLARQERFHLQVEDRFRALADAVEASLSRSLDEGARSAAATLQPAVEAAVAGIARESALLHSRVAEQVTVHLDGVSSRFDAATQAVAGQWGAALARQDDSAQALAQQLGGTLDGVGQSFAERSAALVDSLVQRHAEATGQADQRAAALLQAVAQGQSDQRQAAAEGDAQRLAAWTDALQAVAATLQRQWQQAGADAQARQAQICATLEQTAARMATQAEAQARGTVAEVERLLHTAGEAPRAAAEVVAQLRDKLADSLARDNAMLEERSRVMATLNTLLQAVQHTATEQKTAIDRLVQSSADWLAQAGARFDERVAAEGTRLDGVAAQLTASAVEVAALGEAFGAGVEQFSRSNEQLMAHLQRVDDTLGKSMARSDEQLAYYVAQAREVIDLSLASQQQVVDDLQRIARGAAASAEPATGA